MNPTVSIPIIQPGFYTTNRVLVDPVTNEAVQSNCDCGYKVILPCAYVPEFLTRTIDDVNGPCIPSWCKLIHAIESSSASALLTTNGAGNVTPALTTAEKDSLEETAKMILKA